MSSVSVRLGTGRFAADLEVGPRGGHLAWHLPGPDRRYTGGLAKLDIKLGRPFLVAVSEAWELLQRLRARADGLTLTQEHILDRWLFRISTGGYGAGVVPFASEPYATRIRVNTEQELTSFKSVVEQAIAAEPRLRAIASEP